MRVDCARSPCTAPTTRAAGLRPCIAATRRPRPRRHLVVRARGRRGSDYAIACQPPDGRGVPGLQPHSSSPCTQPCERQPPRPRDSGRGIPHAPPPSVGGGVGVIDRIVRAASRRGLIPASRSRLSPASSASTPAHPTNRGAPSG